MKKPKPDLSRASFALDVAMYMLDTAKDKFNEKNYVAAFEESRNSVRMASSAILFRDGRVFKTLNQTMDYLDRTYSTFPIKEWKHLESIDLASGSGSYHVLLRLVRKIFNIEKHESKQALLLAWRFLDSTRGEFGL
ncbi:Uncharacterised protein [Candidatus Bilamarchaeum dharawalense]|uniref:Uncharacterized protein n=1 Tax=Candidatus Bilamarchaeum dharawalense TaxID=2885759 RepID=A0A5E4LQ21_9ARCH|nr:Uncharacterised protein [Candidatus Bilamarchaeum dharawalense]